MKTLFITSFHPHISRNILLTPVLEMLKEKKDLRIVIVTADYKVDYFEKTFGDENVFVEGVKLYRASRTKRGLFFKRLGLFLLNTPTTLVHKKYQYYCKKKYVYYVCARFVGLVGRSLLVRCIVRKLDLLFSPKDLFKDIYDKYNPNIVFSTDIQNENDVSLMQDARRRKVNIVGMLRSWDNTTMRIMRIFPDKLLVGSRLLFNEMIEFYNYPTNKMVIVGNPHIEKLKNPTMSKEDLYNYFGLNPELPLIFFAPSDDHLARRKDINKYMLELLSEVNANILVRFPPTDTATIGDFKKPENMFYDKPGVSFGEKICTDREIGLEDNDRLTNEINYSDIIISGPTSIPMDAVFLDKPSIMAEIYPTPCSFCDCIYNFKTAHIVRMLAIGGVTHVESEEKLFSLIDDFLKNPNLFKAERAKTRSIYFSHTDGNSSNRITEEILNFIYDQDDTSKHSK